MYLLIISMLQLILLRHPPHPQLLPCHVKSKLVQLTNTARTLQCSVTILTLPKFPGTEISLILQQICYYLHQLWYHKVTVKAVCSKD